MAAVDFLHHENPPSRFGVELAALGATNQSRHPAVVTSVQEEFDPMDDETDEDEDNNNNESSKGPSNANAFSVLETAME
ncbi:hypothetical protein TNCV_675541 [Trichonephila clavipes]|nr:hypothetical protein TNCV_675541 [Trichonephila clavipes]